MKNTVCGICFVVGFPMFIGGLGCAARIGDLGGAVVALIGIGVLCIPLAVTRPSL